MPSNIVLSLSSLSCMTAYSMRCIPGAMSFSPTGKIASSRRKISGENDGQLMVPAFSDYQLSVKRKCGISILNANNWSVCLRNFLEILTRMTTTHSWCQKFFSCTREHHVSFKFELAPSNERARIAHCFSWVAERIRHPIALHRYQG